MIRLKFKEITGLTIGYFFQTALLAHYIMKHNYKHILYQQNTYCHINILKDIVSLLYDEVKI